MEDQENIQMLDLERTPESIACSEGNVTELKELLRQYPFRKVIDSQLLFTVIDKLNQNTASEQIQNYKMCFEVLLEDSTIDVNCTNNIGNTPLHYTVKYKWNEQTRLLLERGANIGLKNSKGQIPIEGIDYQILNDFFDSKVTSHYPNYSIYNKDYFIDLNYSFLIGKPNRDNTNQNTNQLYPIQFISQSAELKNLILHPLIRYLIWVKSEKLRFFYLYNVFILVLLILTLLFLTFLRKNSCYSTFMIVFICVNTVRLILMILDCIFSEMSCKVYVKHKKLIFALYLSIPVILLLILLIKDTDWNKILTAICIGLITLDISKIIMTMPYFKEMSVHLYILKQTTFTLLKVLLFYIIILLSFSFALYILDDKFYDATNKGEGFFIVRVLAMMVGQVNINFDSNSVFYYIFMLLFILMVMIVLLNIFSNVTDTNVGKTRLSAKLVFLTYQVELITSSNNLFNSCARLKECLPKCNGQLEVTYCEYINHIQIYPNKNISTINLQPSDAKDLKEIVYEKFNLKIFNALLEKIKKNTHNRTIETSNPVAHDG